MGTFGGSDLTNPFTIAVWLNTTFTTAIRCICGVVQGAGANTLLQIQVNSNSLESLDADKMRFTLRADGGLAVSGAFTNDAIHTDGVWHSLVATFDGDNNTIVAYLDGTSIGLTYAAQTTPTAFSNFASGFLIGARENRGTNDAFFSGSLAEFAIWTRALTAAEAGILADGFSPLFVPNSLRNYLPIIGRASPEPELRQGSNGTVTGTTNLAHPRIIYPSPAQIRRFTTAVAPPAAGGNDWPVLTGKGFWGWRYS